MKIIPNIQHIENDLIRRIVFVIVFIPLVMFVYFREAFTCVVAFHVEAFRSIVDDVHDVWVKSPYRQNKYIFHDFSKDDF